MVPWAEGGGVRDVGPLSLADEVLDLIEAAIVVVDSTGRISAYNRAAEELYGWSRADALGRLALELGVAPSEAGLARARLEEALSGRPWQGEFPVQAADGRTVRALFNAAPLFDHRGDQVGTVTVSVPAGGVDRKAQAQAAVAQASQAVAAVTGRRLRFLLDASTLLASTNDYRRAVDRLAHLAVSALGDLCVIDMVAEDGLERLAVAHRDPDAEPFFVAAFADFRIDLDGVHPVAEVLRTGKPDIINQVTPQVLARVLGDPALVERAQALGIRAQMTVPLVASGRVLGAMSMVLLATERRFGAADLSVAEDLARIAGVALEATRLVEDLRAAERAAGFLLRASRVLAEATTYRSTLERLAGVAVPVLGDVCLIDVVGEQGGIQRMAARHADPARQAEVDRLGREYAPDPAGLHPSVEVIRTGRSVRSVHMTEEFLRATSRDDEHLRLILGLGFQSYMSVPLVADGAVLGAVTLISAGSGRRFGDAELALAEELAGQVAAVVAGARRHEQQHRIADLLQHSLLPDRLPTVPGLALAARHLPGTMGAEVGGDWYDAIAGEDGVVRFVTGDVAGHDMDAATVMGRLRHAFDAFAVQGFSPAETLGLLRRLDAAAPLGRIATVLCGSIDPRTGDLVLATAGHPAPLLVSARGVEVAPLVPGTPVGAPHDRIDGSWSGRIEPGDTVVCFTDGLVERRGTDLDVGVAELVEVVAAAAGRPLDELCDAVLSALVGPTRSDDVALFALRRDAPPT